MSQSPKLCSEDFGIPISVFVGNILGAFSRALSDRMDEAVEQATGLSKSQCYVVVQVGTEPQSCIETLRRMLNVDHSTLVRALKKLEDAKLVKRIRGDTSDARLVRVSLTNEGEDCFTKILDSRRAGLNRSVSGLSGRELNQLQVLIGKMTSHIVDGGDDQHYVCRLCELEACPQEICPINCAPAEHFELPETPFRRKTASRFSKMALRRK